MTAERRHARDAIRDGVIHVRDYMERHGECVPIAIPSKLREKMLCEQTLAMLQRYNYDMGKVHVFVDPTFERAKGCNEYDLYYRYLRENGFEEVQVHPGGKNLPEQYARIFQFFQQERWIILMSDTVPRIVWRPKKWDVEVTEMPNEYLLPVVRIGFKLCEVSGARAWSLAACKAGINLQAGVISRKCGLLCGNFCGVRMMQDTIPMKVSGYTTDVEFSLRTWKQDGAMIRFLGIAADHKYRSRGGHRLTNAGEKKRHEDD